MTKMMPLLVVAAALVDAEGRVLIQRRTGGQFAGLWEFPGGKVEAGETPEHALVREVHEELGIVVEAADLEPVAFSSTPSGDRSLVLLMYKAGRWSGDPRPLAADELAWRRPHELIDLPMPPADHPLAAALIAAAPEGEYAGKP